MQPATKEIMACKTDPDFLRLVRTELLVQLGLEDRLAKGFVELILDDTGLKGEVIVYDAEGTKDVKNSTDYLGEHAHNEAIGYAQQFVDQGYELKQDTDVERRVLKLFDGGN